MHRTSLCIMINLIANDPFFTSKESCLCSDRPIHIKLSYLQILLRWFIPYFTSVVLWLLDKNDKANNEM